MEERLLSPDKEAIQRLEVEAALNCPNIEALIRREDQDQDQYTARDSAEGEESRAIQTALTQMESELTRKTVEFEEKENELTELRFASLESVEGRPRPEPSPNPKP